ncbi:hypothetical protein BC937DRAFT_94785 [Endogone sp. FLAS-F59071]|nr:hypothetical protein BC937DRAFT_94785 [Endogone sp. FLAS-F59071]|eukprot:RUS13782.1 hypothetical protein BC937DRAFT_94785 [Endogone sp. FLAS-F59071]
MGVTCVVRWIDAKGMPALNSILDNVTKLLHGKSTGRWNMTCKVFRDTNPASKAGTGKYLYQVAFSQQSRYVYCMVDGSVIVEADKELENVLGKLKNLWVIRQSAPVEVCSSYYLLFGLGKFEPRLCIETENAASPILTVDHTREQALKSATSPSASLISFLVPLTRVEYHPCTMPNACTALLTEFVRTITPPAANLSFEIEHDYGAVGLSTTEFTPAHTAYQYMQLFRRDSLL